MVAALLIAWSVAAPPSALPSIDHAIQLFDNFDDAGAAAAFREILAANPPTRIAAKAHLYLGLLAFNGHDPDLAQQEFQKAVHADSSVELPEGSPKARIALEEARSAVLKGLDAERAHPPRLATEVGEPSRSHLLSLTLGGVAVAA